MNNITFGDESVGYYETVAGGAGAVSVVLYYSISEVCDLVTLYQNFSSPSMGQCVARLFEYKFISVYIVAFMVKEMNCCTFN